jgi:hypothetical protein
MASARDRRRLVSPGLARSWASTGPARRHPPPHGSGARGWPRLCAGGFSYGPREHLGPARWPALGGDRLDAWCGGFPRPTNARPACRRLHGPGSSARNLEASRLGFLSVPGGAPPFRLSPAVGRVGPIRLATVFSAEQHRPGAAVGGKSLEARRTLDGPFARPFGPAGGTSGAGPALFVRPLARSRPIRI